MLLVSPSISQAHAWRASPDHIVQYWVPAAPREQCLLVKIGMAAALIDRLMHHCHVVNIRGNSYRMREHTDLWQAIQPGYEEPPSESAREHKKKEAETH